MLRKKIIKINIIHISVLLALTSLLIWLSVPSGHLFGSNTDWFCQHVKIAEYMRTQFYATGHLIPDFSGLGGGSNFFTLSYYGFLRPDVLLSYFLPQVSMATIIQGYAIAEILLGCTLLYLWLCRQGIRPQFCFTAGVLYTCANCLFQAHRQIMFVNYLPFLILAFMAIDNLLEKEPQAVRRFLPHNGIVLSLFMILLHSFYFFPACFVACTVYFFFQAGQKARAGAAIWIKYLFSTAVAVCLAMLLLLPTGLAILENGKDVKGTGILELLLVNPSLHSLLYSPYGCGLTIICLYALFLSIRRKKTRTFSTILFCLLFFLVCYWILNGTLYARPKSLIPFTPLLLFLTAQTLDELDAGKIRQSVPLALLCLIPAIICAWLVAPSAKILILADGILLIIYAGKDYLLTFLLSRRAAIRHVLRDNSVLSYGKIALLCALPVLIHLSIARTENYVSVEKAESAAFSQEEISDFYKDKNSRLDVLESPMTNSNQAALGLQNKSTVYSSVTNTAYNELIYDTLKMPVSIRNRVAVNADANPFQEYLMGVRYIQTKEDKLPAGYQVKSKRGKHVLAENPSVLPMAYGSTALMAESDYDTLNYPQNLDTLANRTVVPAESVETTEAFLPYQSQMKSYPLPDDFLERLSTKEEKITRELPVPLKNEVLLLSFDVDYSGEQDISVTINSIHNRLSGASAPYPNHNTTFTYMLSGNTLSGNTLSGNKELRDLDITFSKGSYKISNVKAYAMPMSALSHPGVKPFTYRETEGRQLLNGSVAMDKDGYFVTSFAYCGGYSATVDGEKIEPQKINKAFVGFPLKKGTHEIVLTFHAPGLTAGSILSLLALCYLFAANLISSLRAPGHQESVLRGIGVVTFTDSVSGKAHPLVKTNGGGIARTYLQMDGGDTDTFGQPHKAVHKEMSDTLSLAVPAHGNIGHISLIKHHQKAAVSDDLPLILDHQKH